MFCTLHKHFPRYVCSAQCGCFCSSLISCSPVLPLRYFLGNFEMVPVAPAITGIPFAFTFHMRWTSIISSLYFKIFSASFLSTFQSPGIATSINMHVLLLLLLILLLCIFVPFQERHLFIFKYILYQNSKNIKINCPVIEECGVSIRYCMFQAQLPFVCSW